MKKFVEEHAKQSRPQLNDALVARLWAVMIGKYGYRWADLYADDFVEQVAKQEWSKALGELSNEFIAYGLDRCLEEYPRFPPTAGEFKKLCIPDPVEMGYPSASTAWSDVCSEGRVLSHGVVLAAKNDSRCDIYNWRLLPLDRGLRLFEPIYREYIGRAMNGEQFELPVMIEDKVGKPVTWVERKQHASDHLSAMREALNG